MKQKYILFALLGLIGASCSNQDLEDQYIDANQVQVTANISNSRVSFTEADKITYANWENGDAITLSTPTQGNLNYTATVSESTVTFAPEKESLKDIAGETVYASYPAATMTDGTVALPATENRSDAQTLPFAYAVSSIKDSKVDLQFKHVFAFVKLTITADALVSNSRAETDKSIHQIVIKSAGQPLGIRSGSFAFDTQKANITESSGSIYYTLTEAFNPETETERSIYLPLLPVSADTDISIYLQQKDAEGNFSTLYEITKKTPANGFEAGRVYTLALKKNSSAVIDGESAEIYLAEAGTLSQYITDDIKYTIKSLKLSGYLNSSDIILLRDMAGSDFDYTIKTSGQLAHLDLSEAYIVDDKEYYVSFKTGHCYCVKDVFGRYIFAGCHSLENIKIPKSVKRTIDQHAFYKCTSLTDIDISDINEIGYEAFAGCTSLKNINLPNEIILGSSAFYGCTSLDNIVIPAGVTMGSHVFGNCTSLQNITIEDGVTKIGISAFSRCTSLVNINIPTSVKEIDTNAFDGCSSLTSITIPEGVTEIQKATFMDCSSLKYVYIPNGVTKIDDYAFWKCNNIAEFYSYSTVPPIVRGDNPFTDVVFNNTILYVPKGCIDAYLEAGWNHHFDPDNIKEMEE